MLRILFFILLFQLFTFGLKGQNVKEYDSLVNILPETEGKDKAFLLNRLSFLIRETNKSEAFEFAKEAEKLALSLNDSMSLGAAKENLGWIYYRTNVWEKAFRYSRDAYLISFRIKDKDGIAMALNSLGVIYYKQKNYIEAIKKFKEAYSIGIEVDNHYVVIRSLNNLSLNHYATDNLDSAYYYAYKALQFNEKYGSLFFRNFSYRIIGDILMASDNIEEAIDSYNFSLLAASHQRLESFEASIMHRLGQAYMKKGMNQEAIEILERGKDLALEGNYQEDLIQFYKLLAIIYDKENKFDLAFNNQMAYNSLGEILEERLNRDRLALISAMFEVEKNDSELRFLRSENNFQELQIKSFKTYNILFTVGIVFLAFLFSGLWVMNRRTSEINQKLISNQKKVDSQKVELEKKSFDLARSNRLKDRLFSILGHDLKTPVSQLQSVLGLMSDKNLTQDEFQEISPVLKRNVDGLFVTLDNILSWSRSQMEGFKVQLRPTKCIDVVNQCLELLQHHAEGKGITFNIHVSGELQIWVDLDLFQIIVRNLISNAIKYSKKDSTIEINTKEMDNQVILEIKDYGMGIAPDKLRKIKYEKFSLLDSSNGTDNERGTGLGVNLCKEFTQMMGGTIEFDSQRNIGTTVKLSFKKVQVISSKQDLGQHKMMI